MSNSATLRHRPLRRFLEWCLADIRTGETIDLWVLIAGALLFTILGATGVSKVQTLSSVVLGLLAVLAISMVRTRQQTRALLSSWHQERTRIFDNRFPESYYAARQRATNSYAFAGMTMRRTFSTMRDDVERILDGGGKVRVLLPDPDNDVLMTMVAASRRHGENADSLAVTIRSSLREIAATGAENHPEVRVTSVLPRLGLNLIDIEHPDAFAMVQMYQYRPDSEPSPIFTLGAADAFWLSHFRSEFERMWDDAQEWSASARAVE